MNSTLQCINNPVELGSLGRNMHENDTRRELHDSPCYTHASSYTHFSGFLGNYTINKPEVHYSFNHLPTVEVVSWKNKGCYDHNSEFNEIKRFFNIQNTHRDILPDVVVTSLKNIDIHNRKRKRAKTILSFLKLEPKWNGYSALAFTRDVIDKALVFNKTTDIPFEVFPTGRNSVQFEIEKKEAYLEVEVFSSKYALYYENKIDDSFIELTYETFEDVINKINEQNI